MAVLVAPVDRPESAELDELVELDDPVGPVVAVAEPEFAALAPALAAGEELSLGVEPPL